MNDNPNMQGEPGGPPVQPPTYQAPPPPPPEQPMYTQPMQPPPQMKQKSPGIGSMQKEKWPAAVLAFTLGTFGLHKFYLGYKTEGLIMLLVSVIGSFCFGLGTFAMLVIGMIEAVKYVTLTEEEFQAYYVRGYKGWL